jgi:hypothetical protein
MSARIGNIDNMPIDIELYADFVAPPKSCPNI